MYLSQSKPQSNHCWFLVIGCVSFVLGFSLASFRFAPESCAWLQAFDSLATPGTTRGRLETKRDQHHKWQELFDYVYDLIDGTVGVELWREPNVTGDELRHRFGEAVVTGIGAERCDCGKQGRRSQRKK